MALKDDIKAVLTTSLTNFSTEAYRRFAKLTDFNTLSGKVTTLIGSDANKSVRTIANEELAAQLIPENAKEALDTLQEIAAWIQSHPDEAAAINRKLEVGTHEVEGEQKQYDTVKAYVEAYVASQLNAAKLSGSASISINDNTVSLIIDALNANGLSIGESGLKMAVANGTTTGALSSDDWTAFNGKQEQVIVPASTGDGNVITGVELDEDGKTIKTVKGITALTASDFEALTAAECETIFNNALAAAEAASSGD